MTRSAMSVTLVEEVAASGAVGESTVLEPEIV